MVAVAHFDHDRPPNPCKMDDSYEITDDGTATLYYKLDAAASLCSGSGSGATSSGAASAGPGGGGAGGGGPPA